MILFATPRNASFKTATRCPRARLQSVSNYPRSSRFSQPTRSVRLRGRSPGEASGATRNGSLLNVVQSSASCIHPAPSAVLAAVSALRMHSCARCWHSLTLFTGTLPAYYLNRTMISTKQISRVLGWSGNQNPIQRRTRNRHQQVPAADQTTRPSICGYASTNADRGSMLRARAQRTMWCPVDICGQLRPIF
jgi:hypothetical protein